MKDFFKEVKSEMDELKRLKKNIEILIEAGYEDEMIDNMVHDSCDLNDLNHQIEDELSYAE